MKKIPLLNIAQLVQSQRTFFDSGATKDIAFRKKALVRFRESILRNEQRIIDALQADFKKPAFETVATEISVVLKELDLTIRHLKKWSQSKKVSPALLNFPSKAYVHYEPYGTVLIIAPWNYPFQLAMTPLIGAIAAGNTAVVKPSELTSATSALICEILSETFDSNYIAVVEGDKEVAQALTAQRWDYIFFTGSVPVGKIIYQAAAKHLTPVTLELGGKSPCVVDKTAHVQQAAKRMVWGKFINAGQTCIAPDYILVHVSKKEALLRALKEEITRAYGLDPKQSDDFARIINTSHFNRLTSFLSSGTLITGGSYDKENLYIAPTVMADVTLEDAVMQEEIFGPVLPVMTWKTKDDVTRIIKSFEKPLSAYVFSRNRNFRTWFEQHFSYGGGVHNDTIVHYINDKLPFGGVGHSGIGSYQGKHSFYVFSHAKSLVKRGTWLDIPVRYAPYGDKLDLLRKALKWL